jgi:acetyl esterase/lipase
MNRLNLSACLLAVMMLAQLIPAASAQDQAARLAEREARFSKQTLDNLFRFPNQFKPNAKQVTQLAALREKLGPSVVEQTRDLSAQINAVYTQEQQRNRNAVTQEIRKLKLDLQQTRQRINEELGLTAAQMQQLAALQTQQQKIQAPVRQAIQKITGNANRRQGGSRYAVPPTHADQKYGPHDRHIYDVFLAESDPRGTPTPVLLSIHGGGFKGGNRSVNAGVLRECLANGISVVALTYRFSTDEIQPSSFVDAARAIQTIRSKSKEWNLDPTRFASMGGSAGAGLSLWLAFHDDMADPDSDDPIARQSTRLTCAYVSNGQSTYDPRTIRDMFPGSDTWKHPAFPLMYGIDMDKLDDQPSEKYELMEYVSPITHLTKDDPPVVMSYNWRFDEPVTNINIGVHHPDFGIMLNKAMAKHGIACHVYAKGKSLDGKPVMTEVQFIKKHFGME